MSYEAGTLIWKIKADVTQLEKALGGSERAVERTAKRGGGFIDLLTSKWAIAAGVATGAAYAMIQASPSLGFAMEEVQYRFEEMFAILGEEFAPLIEEIVLPALDAFLPVVAEIAPRIGEAVDAIVTLFKSDEAQEYIGRVIDALERIGTVVWDIVEPALGLIWNVLEVVGPPILGLFVNYLEWIASNLETAAWWAGWVSGTFKGPLLEAITWVSEKLETLLGWIDKVIKGFKDIIALVPQLPELPASAEGTAGEKLFNLGKLFGSIVPGGALLYGGFQTGGIVPRTGPYLLHEGEYVMPTRQTFQTSHVAVDIHIGPVTLGSELEIRSLTERISRELKNELERSVW